MLKQDARIRTSCGDCGAALNLQVVDGTIQGDQGWWLALAWYGPDRRDPAWRRRNLEENEALFAELGLVSPFWKLRPAKASS
jgi:hypothetical protein